MVAPFAVATLDDWMCQPAMGVVPATALVAAGTVANVRSPAVAVGGGAQPVNPMARRVASVAAPALVRRYMASASVISKARKLLGIAPAR